jgi:hypothetical protein
MMVDAAQMRARSAARRMGFYFIVIVNYFFFDAKVR